MGLIFCYLATWSFYAIYPVVPLSYAQVLGFHVFSSTYTDRDCAGVLLQIAVSHIEGLATACPH